MSDAGGDDALTVTSSTNSELKVPPRWDPQHCTILARWAEIAASYQWLHLRAFLAVSKTNRRFSIPIIILSTLAGSASLSTSSLPLEYQAIAPSIIGVVSLSTGILGTVSEFLRVAQRVEGHRTASLGFGSLARSIRAELSMPVVDRSMHGAEFIHAVKREHARSSDDVLERRCRLAMVDEHDARRLRPEVEDVLAQAALSG